MSDEVLDVDLLAFERGSGRRRNEVVDAVMSSLRHGFVYTAHDLPDVLLDDAYAKLGAFFDLAEEDKARYHAPGTHGQVGYTGLLVETAADAEVADWKEMLNWGHELTPEHPLSVRYPHRYRPNVFPDDVVPGIGDTLRAFHEVLAELQRRFLRVIAVGLGCDERFFDHMLVDGATLSRAINYPPMTRAPGTEHVWAAEHADINLITALPRATSKGLQIKIDDHWIDAAPPPGHVIVNTGMMLEHVTNGTIPSGVHRVVADTDHDDARLSVVQFCHPSPWTVLAPVASCINEQTPQLFAPISAADRLDQVLYEINLLDDAR